MKVGDVVRIGCPVSKYDGVTGEVFAMQESSGYAVVDMPKGTEFALEGIEKNKIAEQLTRNRKTPLKRCPKGDPQWFPARWLVVLRESESDVQDADLFLDSAES
jgi:hypothetical protein